jgi:A/G-specific adenine glycosylase
MNPPVFIFDPALPRPLLDWYAENARALPFRADREPYHVWLSEIMLQQTRVEAVCAYYVRFLAALPTIEALAQADEQRLLKLWEGLGYYNRARALQKAAKRIVAEHGGVFPSRPEQILALPGVGAYTAGAIASICFDLPVPAVDGNVLRVTARLFDFHGAIDEPKIKRAVADGLAAVYPKGECGAFTQSLMELGATVCVPGGAPRCALCPVLSFCKAFLNGTARALPVRREKRVKKEQTRTVFILRQNSAFAVRRRPKNGLLAGMWEFPNVSGSLDDTQALSLARAWGTQPAEILKSVNKQHIFTHIKWNMRAYYILCAEASSNFVWATGADLAENYALPTAFRIFL